MNQAQTTYVIVGGTSGIGAALAKQIRADGHIVHIASRQTGLDISQEQSIYRYFESVGAFDHLVITAGSSAPAGKVVDVAIDDAKSAFDTKFWGTVCTIKHAARYIKSAGSITLTTGMLSRKVVANTYTKTAINAALEAVTKVLAKELAPIRVNAISPGLTDTPAYQHLSDSDRSKMFSQASEQLPAGQIGSPQEIAQAYRFAIDNPFVTGSIIDINGGALVS
ncbi:SDR family oxidoreductase [Shewanella colwelliana]|nr:SDR family oxidoreductase [Shewanella colwelliana]